MAQLFNPNDMLVRPKKKTDPPTPIDEKRYTIMEYRVSFMRSSDTGE
jgi:hypothetical protein